MGNPRNNRALLADRTGDALIGDRQANVADPAALTDVSETITGYTAHASGAVAVTSNAATDLDTTAAALATLENEVTSLAAATGVLENETAVVRTAVLSILNVLEEHGLMTAS